MSTTAAINSRIARHSRDTGIPQKELKRICLEAGLDQLAKEGIRITKKKTKRKPAAK